MIIDNPMDISTLEKFINNGRIKTKKEFIFNFNLIFNNAFLFNKPGSYVYRYAEKLQAAVLEKFNNFT